MKLTPFARSGGCAAKLAPGDLHKIIGDFKFPRAEQLMVGCETGDDAAVYRLNDEQAIIFTTDFITPVCDDPFLFGEIAAANAVSDVYAMGGQVVMALNICAFPAKGVPHETLQEIIRGGASKVAAAGGVVAGGHTVKDNELKYGLAVVGLIEPAKVLTNAKAAAGDLLILTKKIGSGVLIANLQHYAEQPGEPLNEVYASMQQLNDKAVPVMHAHRVSACTDVTGFGLAVHAGKMADATNTTFILRVDELPNFTTSLTALQQHGATSSGKCNRQMLEERRAFTAETTLSPERVSLCFDPQTSGGLLMSVPEAQAADCLRDLIAAGYPHSRIIGSVEPRRRSYGGDELSIVLR